MTGRILLITGSRSFASWPQEPIFEIFKLFFNKFKFNPWEGDRILVGGARGIDMMALNYLRYMGLHHNKVYSFAFDVMKADWDKYGKAAGPIRNTAMVKKCTQGASIWDGESRGTKHCLEELEKAGKLLMKVVL